MARLVTDRSSDAERALCLRPAPPGAARLGAELVPALVGDLVRKLEVAAGVGTALRI